MIPKTSILTNPGDGHMHKVVFLLTVRVILKALQEFQQNLLGDLTPSSLEISEPCQSEMSVEIMSSGIKRPTNGQGIGVRRLASGKLQLGSLLVGKLGLVLDLYLLVAHLGCHQVLLVVRHDDLLGNSVISETLVGCRKTRGKYRNEGSLNRSQAL